MRTYPALYCSFAQTGMKEINENEKYQKSENGSPCDMLTDFL
jgi:hypothetical protein